MVVVFCVHLPQNLPVMLSVRSIILKKVCGLWALYFVFYSIDQVGILMNRKKEVLRGVMWERGKEDVEYRVGSQE